LLVVLRKEVGFLWRTLIAVGGQCNVKRWGYFLTTLNGKSETKDNHCMHGSGNEKRKA